MVAMFERQFVEFRTSPLGRFVITLPVPSVDGRAIAVAMVAPDRIAVLTNRNAVWIKPFPESQTQ